MLSSCCKVQTQLSEREKKELRWQKEIDLLEFYGMKLGYNCFLFDYEVEYQNNLYSIHTFSAGDPDLEILVLLHGFAISNVHYCRVYKELSQKFRIFSIDLPGMGYSSKENIKITTKEEAIDFFLGMISKFILELFPGRKVIVGGHSFGGYIATHLLIRYPELFQQLYLLSPAGMTHYDANQIKELQDTSRLSFFQRMFFDFVQRKWDEQLTIVTIKNFWYGNFCINMYLKKRMHLVGKEYDLWEAYVHEMLSLPNGSEKSLFILLHFPKIFAMENYSIEYLITENYLKIKDIPIYIYFGDTDWMDQLGAYNLQKKSHILNISVRKIPNTSHQLNFLNPQGFLEQLFKDSQFSKQNSCGQVFQENEIIFN